MVVVPGFTAGHAEHGVVTLGRGGTDLTAVFFAARLGSKRVRLLKDVDGVYAEDPAENPRAERYGALGLRGGGGSERGPDPAQGDPRRRRSSISRSRSPRSAITKRPSSPRSRPRKEVPVEWQPLRVALLGCGAVGAGVLSYLEQRPDLFRVNPVLVRHPELHASEGGAVFTSSLDEALAGDPDLVIELIGGADYPAEIMCAALAPRRPCRHRQQGRGGQPL